jgi:hypothetical protein
MCHIKWGTVSPALPLKWYNVLLTLRIWVCCVSLLITSDLLTYLLTPWSTVLIEKLTGFQLVK